MFETQSLFALFNFKCSLMSISNSIYICPYSLTASEIRRAFINYQETDELTSPGRTKCVSYVLFAEPLVTLKKPITQIRVSFSNGHV